MGFFHSTCLQSANNNATSKRDCFLRDDALCEPANGAERDRTRVEEKSTDNTCEPRKLLRSCHRMYGESIIMLWQTLYARAI